MDAKSGTIFKEGNLKIGGEGMKGYYGQIVPQVAKEVIKKSWRKEPV